MGDCHIICGYIRGSICCAVCRGTADVHRCFLAANVLLIIAQSANVVYAFRNRHKDIGIALLVCLLIGIGLMWALYIWSWNYTVKALTTGFE